MIRVKATEDLERLTADLADKRAELEKLQGEHADAVAESYAGDSVAATKVAKLAANIVKVEVKIRGLEAAVPVLQQKERVQLAQAYREEVEVLKARQAKILEEKEEILAAWRKVDDEQDERKAEAARLQSQAHDARDRSRDLREKLKALEADASRPPAWAAES